MQSRRIKSRRDNNVYRFWGAPGTKDSRERTADQTLGTASSRSIVKDKVLVTLKEYTGPADPTDTSAPSTFKVAKPLARV